MKIRFLLQLGFVSLCLVLCSWECGKTKFDLKKGTYELPTTTYTINGTSFTGQGESDTAGTYRAIVVPCNNNNTLRLYYSSAANYREYLDSPLIIVSYSKAATLKKNECYLEVTTSATDTWLSTGTGNAIAKVSHGSEFIPSEQNPWRYLYNIVITDATMQHFTSIPLNDFGKVSVNLFALRLPY